jgi:hypothetical protein
VHTNKSDGCFMLKWRPVAWMPLYLEMATPLEGHTAALGTVQAVRGDLLSLL